MTFGRVVFALLAFSLSGYLSVRFKPRQPDVPALMARVASHGAHVTLDPSVLGDPDGSSVETSRPLDYDLARCLPWVDEELGRYPTGFLRRLDLRAIVLCRRLHLDGKQAGGVAMGRLNAIGLDFQRFADERYLRQTVHHELFHMIDWRVHGNDLADPAWDRLNAPGFDGYLGSGWAALGVRGYEGTSSSERGFLTGYSRAAGEEDRAEIFAHAVIDPRGVAERAARDPYVARKLAFVESLAARAPARLGPEFWAKCRENG